MGCPFCELTDERVDGMTDEEAGNIYLDYREKDWCFIHTIAALHVRKMTAATGRKLIKAIIAVGEAD